ncbi:hypothetical protein MKW98_007294, partial [Papaver atlanticum]
MGVHSTLFWLQFLSPGFTVWKDKSQIRLKTLRGYFLFSLQFFKSCIFLRMGSLVGNKEVKSETFKLNIEG